MTQEGSREDLLHAFIDEPMTVEARGLLLRRDSAPLVVSQSIEREGDEMKRGALIFAPEIGMAIGLGKPPATLADDLRDLANERGMVQEAIELHLPMEVAPEWLALSRARAVGEHRVQALPSPLDWAGGDLRGRHEVAVLAKRSDRRLSSLPRALRAEFAALDPWPVVVASLAGDCIASIASAFVETEGYFDVSIDTVSDFRREGFGAACAAALIQHQLDRGKAPVWMVKENNRASLALATRLGFEDVGRVHGLMLR